MRGLIPVSHCFEESLPMNARISPALLEPGLALERVGQAWDNDILRQLTEYIFILS